MIAPSYRRISFFSAHLILALPYLFLIRYGSFTVDDWGQLNFENSLFSQIDSWTTLWSYRPVSWIIIPTLVYCLNDNYVAILLCHLSLLYLSMKLIADWRALGFSPNQKLMFRISVFAPALCSTLILSPINQFSATLSFLFFALSTRQSTATLTKTQVTSKTILLMIISLLAYEITLPLIVLYFILRINSRKNFYSSIFYFLFIVFTVAFWQKIFTPILFDTELSRINSPSLRAFGTFFYTTFFSTPINLIDYIINHLWILMLIFLVYKYFVKNESIVDSGQMRSTRIFLTGSVVLAVLCSSVLFLVSGSFAQIFGYLNRGMSSVWVLISLLCAIGFGSQRSLISILAICVAFANYFMFWDVVLEAGKATEARNQVVSQISNKLDSLENIPHTLILDVPCFTENSKFKTVVFCTAWDARGALLNKKVEFDHVEILQDGGFIANFRSLPVQEEVLVLLFNEEFKLIKSEILTGENLKRRSDLVARAFRQQQLQLTAREECASSITKLLSFQIPKIPAVRVLECAKDPF